MCFFSRFLRLTVNKKIEKYQNLNVPDHLINTHVHQNSLNNNLQWMLFNKTRSKHLYTIGEWWNNKAFFFNNKKIYSSTSRMHSKGLKGLRPIDVEIILHKEFSMAFQCLQKHPNNIFSAIYVFSQSFVNRFMKTSSDFLFIELLKRNRNLSARRWLLCVIPSSVVSWYCANYNFCFRENIQVYYSISVIT